MKSSLLISSSILIAGGGIMNSIGSIGSGQGSLFGVLIMVFGGIIFIGSLVRCSNETDDEDS